MCVCVHVHAHACKEPLIKLHGYTVHQTMLKPCASVGNKKVSAIKYLRCVQHGY